MAVNQAVPKEAPEASPEPSPAQSGGSSRGIDVDLSESDDDGDDGDDSGQSETRQADAATRQERRRERGNLRTQLAERDTRISEMEERHRRELGGVHERLERLSKPQETKKDPIDEQLEVIDLKSENLRRQWDAMSPDQKAAQSDDIAKKAKDLQASKMELLAERAISKRRPSAGQDAASRERQFVQSRWPDVMYHQQAAPWTVQRYAFLVADGQPKNPETFEKAVKEARARWGIGQDREGARVATQRKLAGIPSSGGGGGSGGGGKVHLSVDEMKMADAMYKHSIPDEKERYRVFAKQNKG